MTKTKTAPHWCRERRTARQAPNPIAAIDLAEGRPLAVECFAGRARCNQRSPAAAMHETCTRRQTGPALRRADSYDGWPVCANGRPDGPLERPAAALARFRPGAALSSAAAAIGRNERGQGKKRSTPNGNHSALLIHSSKSTRAAQVEAGGRRRLYVRARPAPPGQVEVPRRSISICNAAAANNNLADS
jgi:hypothetical protein